MALVQAVGQAPGAVPLLGHAVPLLRRPLAYLRELRAYGDVVRVRVGPVPVYVVNSPDLLHTVMVRQARNFDKGMQGQAARPVAGLGLSSSDGALHLRQRRLMQPAFHRERIAHYVQVMEEQAYAKAAAWELGESLDVPEEMADLAAGIAVRALFSMELRPGTTTAVRTALDEVMAGVVRSILTPGEFLKRLPTPARRRFDAAVGYLRGTVTQIIAERRAGGEEHEDVLAMLLDARDADTGLPMDEQQLHDEVMTLLIAGTDTTALAMCWMFHELGRHPEVAERLHREVTGHLGGRRVTFEDLPRLPYARRVVDETLRLHSPAWMLMRRATAQVALGPVTLPKGAHVLLSPYAMHRDPQLYPEPDSFDPDRWLPERRAGLPRGAYVPFATGNRKCLGDQFAQAEMTVVAATVGARLRLTHLPGPGPREVPQFLIKPSRLHMRAEAWGPVDDSGTVDDS